MKGRSALLTSTIFPPLDIDCTVRDSIRRVDSLKPIYSILQTVLYLAHKKHSKVAYSKGDVHFYHLISGYKNSGARFALSSAEMQ